MHDHYFLRYNLTFFSADSGAEGADNSTDQDSTGQAAAGQGGAVENTSDLDALTKVIKDLTDQNKSLIKELSEVKAANLKLAAAMPGGDDKPKSFEDAFRALFDYGQNRKE